MTAYTLEIAKKHLEMCLEAEEKVLVNQSYTIAGKTYTRADLAQIRAEIKYWDNEVEKITSRQGRRGRNRAYRIVPRDL